MTPVWIGAGAAGLLAVAAVWWLRRNLVQVTIDGDSMAPGFADGDVVLVRRSRGRGVRVGDVIAVAPIRDDAPGPSLDGDRSGGRLWIIKRVAALPGDPIPPDLGTLSTRAGDPVPEGFAILLGDNPDHSYDSRQEGLVDLTRLRGRVPNGGGRKTAS